MRIHKGTISTWGLGLLVAVTLAVALLPPPALAAANDSDADGIPDDLELTEGVALPPGAAVPARTFLPCQAGDDRTQCVAVGAMDLFVIFRKATSSSWISSDPLVLMNLVTRSNAESGLNISLHVIEESWAGSDREILCDAFDVPYCIAPVQKALRITEVTTTPQPVLGYCPQGTPMGLDDATVYTGAIADFVHSVCSGKNCQAYVGEQVPANLVTGEDDVIAKYIEYVTIHEIGHTIALSLNYERRFGGYHYKTGTNFIMDQSIVYKEQKNSNTITFYFPHQYSGESQTGLRLH
jgi:hypothetical protein